MKISNEFNRDNFKPVGTNNFLTFRQFAQLFNYSAFKHVKILINGVARFGWVYRLHEPNADALDVVKSRYNNIVVYDSALQYAPELKFKLLFIANKPIK